MLAFAVLACVGIALSSPIVETTDTPLLGDETLTQSGSGIGFLPDNVLSNALIGDTLIVGTTGWDVQHNGSVGRQITHYVDEDGWHVSLVWMKLDGVQAGNPRNAVYTTLNGLSDGYEQNPSPAEIVHNGYRSGFTTLAIHPNSGSFYPAFHHKTLQSEPFSSYVYHPSPAIPGLWIPKSTPNLFLYEHIWPKTTMGANGYLHVANHHVDAAELSPTQLSYMRWEMNETYGLIPAMPEYRAEIVSQALANVSADIVTNSDGSKVALAACVDRNRTMGEKFLGGQGKWNNDIHVWRSNNSGGGFTESALNITSFLGPVLEGLPDSVFANQDVRRAYTDCSLMYDDEDKLHAAFTVHDFDFLRGKVYNESSIFHWTRNGTDDYWTLIHHQPYNGQPESWGRSTDRPSLYFDDDTGIMWCVMEVVDAGPAQTDTSISSGCASTDIYISASPPGEYNGLLWTKAVNVTNTKYLLPGGALPGESRSETDVSIALNNDGDYLNLFYMLDLDAGCAVQNEGTMTENPMVYHRIPKSILLEKFNEVGEWVVNESLHFNDWGLWEDPGQWLWDEHGGFFTTDRYIASELNLQMESNTDIVSKDGGIISAMVRLENRTLIDYPNLDIWTEVTFPSGDDPYGPLLTLTAKLWRRTTLPNIPINQIVPHDAPAGMYQYHIYAGDYPDSYKGDSFIFTKLPGNAEEFDEFDPADWPVWTSPTIEDPPPEPITEHLFPSEIELSHAWPNPFNPATTLNLNLPAAVEASVMIYDVTGRLVEVLVNGRMQAGYHELTFDGSRHASGVYFARAVVGGKFTEYRKLVLMK
jgi:Secretion system C-terminal sorting domain